MAINDAVKGKALDSTYPCSPAIDKVIEMLNKFDKWIDEIPPTEQPQRFGNTSFRLWHEKLHDVSIKSSKTTLNHAVFNKK